MDDQLDDERTARIRAARQVLAGTDIQAPDDPLRFGQQHGLLDPGLIGYLVVLISLLVVALLLLAFAGMGVASVVFFLLALALLAGWAILGRR